MTEYEGEYVKYPSCKGTKYITEIKMVNGKRQGDNTMKRIMAITTKIRGKESKRVHPELLKRDGYSELDNAGNSVIKIRRWA